jgi:hypothetical protein
MEAAATEIGVRRKGWGGKRIYARRRDNPPWPVKGIWAAASEEQKARAHRMCTGILELWLARKSAAEVARELGVSPVRVWQLSQSALSGMLAGLLKQPRWRGRIEMSGMEGGREELLRLRKKVEEQEGKLKAAEALIAILRGMPTSSPPQREATAATGKAERPSGGKKKRNPRLPRAAQESDGVAADGGAAAR